MKSHYASVITVCDSILLDAAAYYAQDVSSAEKDRTYLRRAGEQRGISFFTITLPSLGKVYDRSLSKGAFLAKEIPQGIKLFKSRPVFLRDLHMKVFTDDGMLRSDPDTAAIYFIRQLCYFAKKLRMDCSEAAKMESLNEFFQIERDLPKSYENTWDSDIPKWEPRYGHPLWGDCTQDNHPSLFNDSRSISHSGGTDWDKFRHHCRQFISMLYPPDYWNLRPKHGPGVTSDGHKGESKYDFPHWPKKLGLWFAYDWFASGQLDLMDEPSDYEPSSRLIMVPKTQKGPRIICAEPVAHQWVQQGLRRYLEDEISKGPISKMIDFRDQGRSRMRALQSSLDGEHCTIDLSSASDRISTRLVEYIFQGHPLLDGLHAARSRTIRQTISDNHPKMIVARKFAPQGSAVTFPIQSLIFACIALYAVRSENGVLGKPIRISDMEKITVFGDDIIAPNTCYNSIVDLLTECGLKVNTDKSFSEGFFRESCGMDAYGGNDVTPAYFLESYTDSPTAIASIVECSNNFMLKGMFITADCIGRMIPKDEYKLIPIVSSTDGNQGLMSFCGSSYEHLRSRWNKDLHKYQYRAISITSKVKNSRGTGYADLSQFYWEDPADQFDWSPGTVGQTRTRKNLVWV